MGSGGLLLADGVCTLKVLVLPTIPGDLFASIGDMVRITLSMDSGLMRSMGCVVAWLRFCRLLSVKLLRLDVVSEGVST